MQISGESGSGKTAIAKQAANYLFQRGFFKDGIIYHNLERVKSIENFMNKLKKGISSEKKFYEINKVFLLFFFFYFSNELSFNSIIFYLS